MQHSFPVNNLVLRDAVEAENEILKEIQSGSEPGLRYLNQLFHLELWYFAYGFMEQKEAFDLALRVIRMHWEDRFPYEELETMETVMYMIMVFYCLPYVQETSDGQLRTRIKTIPETALHDFMENRKLEAKEFAKQAKQQFFPPSLN